MSIVDTIPPAWRLLIKQNQQHSVPKTINRIFFVELDGKDVDILNTTSERIQIQKAHPQNSQCCVLNPLLEKVL